MTPFSFLQEALDLAREMDYQVIEGTALHNLGESYRAIGEPDTSADCFRHALSVRQHADDRHGQAQTLCALGDLAACPFGLMILNSGADKPYDVRLARPARRPRYRDPVTVYAIAQLTIHDRARYQRYVAAFMPILLRHGGTLLAADEHPEVTEGQWDGDKVVLMAFPDRETFTAWAMSPEYREISTDRLAAAETTGILVRGLTQVPDTPNRRLPMH